MSKRYFAVTVSRTITGQMMVAAEDEFEAQVKSVELGQGDFDRYVSWNPPGEIEVTDRMEEVIFD